jgi:hypothetical protein
MPIDGGLIYEIDETEQSFSLQKWILLPLLLIVTIICGYFALPITKTVAVSVPKIVVKDQLTTKDIESIQCGDRVLGRNPVLSDEDRKLFGQEPTCETHYEYLFALTKDDGALTYVTLLRPRDWLESFEGSESILEFEAQTDTGESEGGICVWLDIPEMGTVGWAQLLSINEDFEIKSGTGNVVTGKFIHTSNNVIDLKVEGQDVPIGCTDNHPFWSVDRQDYIKAGELRKGEKVLLYSGETKRVEQKLPRPGPELVYNIEVFGEHVYHVTKNGILVHNAYSGTGTPNPYGRKGGPDHRNRIEQAEDRFIPKGWKTQSGGVADGSHEVAVEVNGRIRFVDLVMENKKSGKLIAIQVGRATKGNKPVAREVRAINDLRISKKFKHVFFFKYNK